MNQGRVLLEHCFGKTELSRHVNLMGVVHGPELSPTHGHYLLNCDVAKQSQSKFGEKKFCDHGMHKK